MILLVRDEDPPTVAAAINAFAVEEGLLPLDLEETVQNPLNMIGVLAGPRVMVSMSDEQVVVAGLESLDIAEAEEWGTNLSASCETEVLAIDVAEDGLRVYVFDGGEVDEEIEVPLHPSGRTRSPQLAGLADQDDGRRSLGETGVIASNVPDLLSGVLQCLGASTPDKESVMMLAFVDPLDDEDDDNGGHEGEGEEDDDEGRRSARGPRFIVQPFGMASLEGKVGGRVGSLHGHVFAVSIAGTGSIEGLSFELSGDALALFMIDNISLDLRTRGAGELEHRVFTAETLDAKEQDGKLIFDVADAFLESADAASPLALLKGGSDAGDLFASMQRMMSAGEQQVLNTISVHIEGIGTGAGTGTLIFGAAAKHGAPVTLASAEAAIPVRVTT